MQSSLARTHARIGSSHPAFHAARISRRAKLAPCSAQASETRVLSVPSLAEAQVAQAAQAIEAAWRAGVKRQRIELLLPLIGATDLDDWPGGIRQQFKAAQPLLEQILRSVKQVDGLQGPLSAEIWDDGDAVACWKGTKLAAVIFPTAATVDKLRKLAEEPGAPDLLLIVNPQWRVGALQQAGNLMSDFGLFGRKAKEEFVGTFTPTYWLTQQRVYGDIVRTLYGYPNQWQVHVDITGPANRAPPSECIATLDEQPTYQQIEALLRARPESSMNKSLVQRLQDEWEFNRKSLDGPK